MTTIETPSESYESALNKVDGREIQLNTTLDAITLSNQMEILAADLKVKNGEKVEKGGSLPAPDDMFIDLPKGVDVIGWNQKPDLTKTGPSHGSIDVNIGGTVDTIPVMINVVESVSEVIKVLPAKQVAKGGTLDPEDFLENPGALGANYEVQWNESPVPTFDKTKQVKIKIVNTSVTPNKIVKTYTCNADVIDNPLLLKKKAGEKVVKGALPNPNDMFIDLPDGATVVGWNQTPDTSTKGIKQGTIDVTISGRTEQVPVVINVVEKVSDAVQIIPTKKVGKGGTLDPIDFVANPGVLGTDYEVQWNESPVPTFDDSKQVKIKIVDKTSSPYKTVKTYVCNAEVIGF